MAAVGPLNNDLHQESSEGCFILQSDDLHNAEKNCPCSMERNDRAADRLNHHGRGIKSEVTRKTLDPPLEQPPLILPEELSHTLKAQDFQMVDALWREHPKLSSQFSVVVQFLQLWCVQPHCYQLFQELLHGLNQKLPEMPLTEGGKVAQFAGSLGFAEKTFSLYQQAMREEGKTFFAGNEKPAQRWGDRMLCLYNIRCAHMKLTHRSPEFGLLLAKSGMLSFFLEDLRHMYDEEHDDLADSSVFVQSVGSLHNCSRNPDARPTMRRLDVIHQLSPYLTSHNTKVKMMALMPLALMVTEEQNDLLVASGNVLGFFLQQVELARQSERHHHDYWCVEELLQVLRNLAKQESNKRVLLSKGVLNVLEPVLTGGTDTEKLRAVGVMWEMAFHGCSSQVIQSNSTLRSLLEDLRNSNHATISDRASKALWVVEGKVKGEDKQEIPHSQPSLKELLQPMENAMQILGLNPMEMLLRQLDVMTGQAQKQQISVPFDNLGHLLSGVLQLIREDVNNAGQFVAKGGLRCLNRILAGQNRAEETGYTLAILRELITGKHVTPDDEQLSPKLVQLLKMEEAAMDMRCQSWVGEDARIAGVALQGEGLTDSDCESLENRESRLSVYVSYHPRDRSVASQIYTHLQNRHYHICQLAADRPADSEAPMVQDMARAIRSSAVVLLCLSQHYQASAHCRMEADYAHELGKNLVVLLVEADFQPAGWLTILLTQVKSIFDLTDSQRLTQTLALLDKVLN